MGLMPTTQALEMAREKGLDLVEVASTAVPPVVRLLDYGKYRYSLEKKERKARKGQKATSLKEMRLRPKINEQDLMTKVNLIKKMLEQGDKVKVSVVLRGRENTHPELGWKTLRKVVESLKEAATVEGNPAMEGSNINLTFAASKQVKAVKPPEQEKEAVNA